LPITFIIANTKSPKVEAQISESKTSIHFFSLQLLAHCFFDRHSTFFDVWKLILNLHISHGK
jgi:hypothetical protein